MLMFRICFTSLYFVWWDSWHHLLFCACSSRSSTDSAGSTGSRKGCLVYVDEVAGSTAVPSAPSHAASSFTKPYIADSTEILLKSSDVDISMLTLNLGDSYAESYCTPRVLTINLTEELGAWNKTDKFYMVLVQRAEGVEYDRYRCV